MSAGMVERLLERRAQLERLKLDLELELGALEDALRVAGHRPVGRPRTVARFTLSEALEAHERFNDGDRDALAVAGNRQYQREHKRRHRTGSQTP